MPRIRHKPAAAAAPHTGKTLEREVRAPYGALARCGPKIFPARAPLGYPHRGPQFGRSGKAGCAANTPPRGRQTLPSARRAIRRFSVNSLDSAWSAIEQRPSKQKRPRRTVFNYLISLKKSGAGEGIRTLDPNLGKVASMVRAVGIEPTLCHQNWILNPARLPVPPRPPIAVGARLALCTYSTPSAICCREAPLNLSD